MRAAVQRSLSHVRPAVVATAAVSSCHGVRQWTTSTMIATLRQDVVEEQQRQRTDGSVRPRQERQQLVHLVTVTTQHISRYD